MFRSAFLRLTLWYLAIIMLISLFFSITLYNILTGELDRGLRRQAGFFRRDYLLDPFNDANLINQFNESNHRIQLNLLYFNVIILILAGGTSYFLAKRTLNPIEEALESQSRFTADASHELRTPLTAMRTELEVALREKLLPSSEAKKVLQSNLEEVIKLEDISNALLILSRIQSPKNTHFEEVSLTELLSSTEGSLKGLAKSKKIKITSEIIETRLEADKKGLLSLLRVFLDNAIKYSPENTEINISNKIEENFVALIIKDEGIGIKKEDLPFIFDRFYRVDASRSEQNVNGFGLGLSIAQKIVENHHGKIEVESKIKTGSTFTIKLPLKQPSSNFLKL